MFQQAGFNRRVRGTRIIAFVWHARVRWKAKRPAELVEFIDSGERAWWGPGGVSWAQSLVFQNLIWPREMGRRMCCRIDDRCVVIAL